MKESKFSRDYPELLVKHMQEGNSYESFGALVNVTIRTMCAWEKKYPAWMLAKEIGKQHELKYWEALLQKGASGQLPNIKKRVTVFNPDKTIKNITIIDEPGKFSAAAVIFALKNKFRSLYRDKIDVETTNNDAIENLSQEEIARRKALYASIIKKKEE
jgi:hypothetical protein